MPCTTDSDGLTGDHIHLLAHLSGTEFSAGAIRKWTDRDPTLSQVRHFVQMSWPVSVPDEMKPYLMHKSELSVLNGCLLWRARVVIPSAGRQAVLGELHESHVGCMKMKALARSYVY